jgi:hypothetical protein
MLKLEASAVDRLNIQTTCVIVWMTMRIEWGDVFRWHWWLFCILLHNGYDSWERNVKQFFWRPCRYQYNDTTLLRAVSLAASSNYKFLSRYFCLKPKEKESFFFWFEVYTFHNMFFNDLYKDYYLPKYVYYAYKCTIAKLIAPPIGLPHSQS